MIIKNILPATLDKAGLLSPEDKAKIDTYAAYNPATQTADGLMSAADKTKLDGLQSYDLATQTAAGLMAAQDKTKLDGLQSYDLATQTAAGLMAALDKTKLDGLQSYDLATQTADGLMSAADKTKLDGLSTGGGGTAYSPATETADGLMSAADKVKLNGLQSYSLASQVNDGLMSTYDYKKLQSLTNYDFATQMVGGLMSAPDKTKLDGLQSYDLATQTAAGLMSAEDFTKVQILYESLELYGVSWDSSNPATQLTRKKTTADFSAAYPWREVKRYNVADNGAVNAKEGEPDFKFDGTNGQVMTKIPKFYYRTTYNGTVTTWEISEKKLTGFVVHPAFLRSDGSERDCFFVGSYPGVLESPTAGTYLEKYCFNNTQGTPTGGKTGSLNAGEKLASVQGYYPMTEMTFYNFKSAATRRGSGWGILNIYQLSAIQMLYLIEHADFNAQSVLGYTHAYPATYFKVGRTGMNDTDVSYTYYRYMDSLFNSLFQWIDGIMCKPGGYDLNGTVYNTAVPTVSGYIKSLSDVFTWSFLPLASGASSTTYITDYVQNNNSSSVDKALIWGGVWYSGAQAGLFNYNCNVGAGDVLWNTGARLSYAT